MGQLITHRDPIRNGFFWSIPPITPITEKKRSRVGLQRHDEDGRGVGLELREEVLEGLEPGPIGMLLVCVCFGLGLSCYLQQSVHNYHITVFEQGLC